MVIAIQCLIIEKLNGEGRGGQEIYLTLLRTLHRYLHYKVRYLKAGSLGSPRGSFYTSDVFYFLLLLAWRLYYMPRDGVLTYFW